MFGFGGHAMQKASTNFVKKKKKLMKIRINSNHETGIAIVLCVAHLKCVYHCIEGKETLPDFSCFDPNHKWKIQ